MDIATATHEHRRSAKIYTYDAQYDVGTGDITWTARVRRNDDGEWQQLSGSVPLSSPGVAALAEEAVRDAVIARIDALDAA